MFNRRPPLAWIAILGAVVALAPPTPAWAVSETDLLIKKLVEKRILTQQEADEIRQDVAKESAAQVAAPTSSPDLKEAIKKMPGGGWLETVKWGGDLRLRHETQLREPAADRSRERFRLRVGFTAKPWDPLELGVRLATGASGDPVSTNQSFTGTFDKKSVFIDKAYAKYAPGHGVALTGGKMDIPFDTAPESLIWDSDVTPEGVVVQWKSPTAIWNGWLRPFLALGAFQIAELANDTGDPAVFVAQTGAEVALPAGLAWQPSLAYYDFTAIEARRTSDVTNAPAGNSTDGAAAAARFRYDYNVATLTNKLTLPVVFGRPVALISDLAINTGAADNNTGWLAGLEIGTVTELLGSWRAYYYYKRLEADSVFGAITDGDFGAGGTNHQGHILGVQMGLNRHASLGLKYFRTDEINDSNSQSAQNRVDTLQADLLMKF